IKSFHLKEQVHDNKGLVRLLDIQKVPLETINVDIRTNSSLLIEGIIKKNVDSISKLKLAGVPRLIVIDCKNLKELDIDFSTDYIIFRSEFVKSIFPKLEELNVKIALPNLHIISDFLKNHSGIKYLYINVLNDFIH